jgi:hypothetical protein
LADTVFQITFPRNAARRQSLRVRAIDDGGLKSASDFSRSVVLNFDPITTIILPPSVETLPDGSPKPGRVFVWGTEVLENGSTLPDGYQSVTVYFTGKDDPRDFGEPCGTVGVSSYQHRVLSREDSFGSFGGQAFTTIPGATLALPDFNQFVYNNLGSGDQLILIRCLDSFQITDSTPDSVLLKVNYRPYVTMLKVRPESAPESANVDLAPLGPGQIPRIELADGQRLIVSVLGSDHHVRVPNPSLPADSLAILYDTNGRILRDEEGRLSVSEGYRVFFQTAQEPGFDPSPSTGLPYVARLAAPKQGEYTIIAEVKDSPISAPNGRTGRMTRRIEIVR